MSSAIPVQGFAYMRKVAEQAMGHKPVSSVSLRSLFQFLPWFSLIVDCDL